MNQTRPFSPVLLSSHLARDQAQVRIRSVSPDVTAVKRGMINNSPMGYSPVLSRHSDAGKEVKDIKRCTTRQNNGSKRKKQRIRKQKSKNKLKPKEITQKDKAEYFYGPYRSDYYLENRSNFICSPEGAWGQITEIITNKDSGSYDVLLESIKKHTECKTKKTKCSSNVLKNAKRIVSSPFLAPYAKKTFDKTQLGITNEINKMKMFRSLSSMKDRRNNLQNAHRLIQNRSDLSLKLESCLPDDTPHGEALDRFNTISPEKKLMPMGEIDQIIKEMEDEDNDDNIQNISKEIKDCDNEEKNLLQINNSNTLELPNDYFNQDEESISSSTSTDSDEDDEHIDPLPTPSGKDNQSEFNPRPSILNMIKTQSRGTVFRNFKKKSSLKRNNIFKRYSGFVPPKNRLSRFSKASQRKSKKPSRGGSSTSMTIIKRSESKHIVKPSLFARRQSFTKENLSLIIEGEKPARRYSYEKHLRKIQIKKNYRKKTNNFKMRKKNSFQLMIDNLKSMVKRETPVPKENPVCLYKKRESIIPSALISNLILDKKPIKGTKMDKRYTINVFSEERSNFNKITAFHDHLISQSNSRNKSNTSRFDKVSGYSDNSIPTPSPNDHKRISGTSHLTLRLSLCRSFCYRNNQRRHCITQCKSHHSLRTPTPDQSPLQNQAQGSAHVQILKPRSPPAPFSVRTVRTCSRCLQSTLWPGTGLPIRTMCILPSCNFRFKYKVNEGVVEIGNLWALRQKNDRLSLIPLINVKKDDYHVYKDKVRV
ncbi:unnamed protein product [Moneuplotes crassus]|uniref:Uncharacterized protein n=1 Tax=Euplotes crassus TaxID=5936 RepID=A0AAD1U2W5_EUPCR|nr:unnamed protein product [Moneuplotes crassus]